jgi:hypothetical protein
MVTSSAYSSQQSESRAKQNGEAACCACRAEELIANTPSSAVAAQLRRIDRL